MPLHRGLFDVDDRISVAVDRRAICLAAGFRTADGTCGGRIVETNVPYPYHGYVCGLAYHLLNTFALEHDLGRVLSNDSGVVTERNPDSVRGADVSFYSFARLPKGPFPRGYLDVPPEIVIEVRSPSQRWSKLTGKAAEYLDAGVDVVCMLDPESRTIYVQRLDQPPLKLGPDEELALPELHASFRAGVPLLRVNAQRWKRIGFIAHQNSCD